MMTEACTTSPVAPESQLEGFLRTIRCFEHAGRHLLESAWYWQPTSLCFTSVVPPVSVDLAQSIIMASTPHAFASRVDRAGFGWILVHRREGEPPPAYLEAAQAALVRDDGRNALYTLRRCRSAVSLRTRRRTAEGTPCSTPLRGIAASAWRSSFPRVSAGGAIGGTVHVANRGDTRWPGAVVRSNDVRLRADGWPRTGRVVVLLDPVRQERLRQLLAGGNRPAGVLRTGRIVRPRRRLAPGAPRAVRIALPAPIAPGRYRLVLSVGQEGSEPFSLVDGAAEVDVEVAPPARGSA
jgi:hypothetical protein